MKKWVLGAAFLAAVAAGCGSQEAASASTEAVISSEDVEWEFQPLMSSQSPAFPFRFELGHERVEAACDAGLLIGFDDHNGTEYPTGSTLSVPAGSRLYWSPWDGTSEISLNAEITFTVYDSSGEAYSGSIQINGTRGEVGEPEESVVEVVYLASLDGQDGLMTAQDEAAGGARITAAGAQA